MAKTDIEYNEGKSEPGAPYADTAMLFELLRLAQQAGAPGEPTHAPSSDDVVERAGAYWAWIKEQQA